MTTADPDGYGPVVADYFSRTPMSGKPSGDATEIFSGRGGHREQGTEVVFHARIRDGRIEDIRYEVFGCPHTIAACAIAAERLTGRAAADMDEAPPESLGEAVAFPAEKAGRMLIIQDALRNCFLAWDNSRLG